MANGTGVLVGVALVAGAIFFAPAILAVGWVINDSAHYEKLPGEKEDWEIAQLSSRQLTAYYAQQDDERIKIRHKKMTPQAVKEEEEENQRSIGEQFNKK